MKITSLLLSLLLAVSPSYARFQTSTPEAAAISTLVLDYSSSSQFTYTSTDVEFSSGVAKLKNQYGDDAYFVATYSSSKNANYSKLGGSLTATSTGSSAIASDKLVFSDAAAAYISYSTLGNFPIGQSYSLKFKYTPDYTTAPAATQRIFANAKTDSDGGWSLLVYHGASPANIVLHAETNSAIKSYNTAWSPTSGQEYEFLAVIDWANAVYRLYIDGVLIGSPPVGSSTRDSIGRILRVGGDHDATGSDISDFSIRDLIIYSGVHQSGAYTPGYSLAETPYLTTDPVITQTNSITATALTAFSAGVTASGSDAVRFHLVIGGTAKYWNGSAWATSDASYAQSNSASTINSNIATAVTTSSTVKVVAVLHSDSGATTPSVGYVRVNYQ